ncbi:hypothetical protein C8J43_10840 [Sphingomonas sp. PP-CE-1G-424]|nr:hypothetical protein C8J43_10840 [Sphingomonas sp. PP-CE-1G-424]
MLDAAMATGKATPISTKPILIKPISTEFVSIKAISISLWSKPRAAAHPPHTKEKGGRLAPTSPIFVP